ncbi:Hypothetical predicted protein [Olea europaea subsp. europaea]|uniref:AT-hook motif nuclear-localized protein n=1 Tax=Olea europaea subsp. europaea TaxID=158383 RepID=A0A8S0UHA3_OLEEU|nr:Hypothetical predicted protein [Olea europaea subsp. europaea]
MDSQDPSAPPPPFRSHHPQQTPTIYAGHTHTHTQTQHPNNSYTISSNNSSATTTATMMQQQNLYPFNTMASAPASNPLDHHFSDKLASGGSGEAGGFSIESARKKRGRPRKYSPDNTIGLGMSPDPATKISSAVAVTDSGGGTPSIETSAKRHRGRPPGSGKRQLNALGEPGVGFTPHVITVNVGEDVASEIMAFSQQGPRTVCILSANGAICNVTLRQPAMSGGTITYEGRFEIISLSGSFFRSESNGDCSRTGGLSVSLAGSDGKVLGGGVAGMLKAASPVQIVVGSFIADGKKPKSGPSLATPVHLLNSRAPAIGAGPSSSASSDSSEENDGGSLNRGSEPYSGHQIPTMPMYSNMAWPNSTIKMFPN